MSEERSNLVTAKRRTRDPMAMRARLVDAAIFLIRQQGFTATSVDRICEKAGTTKGSFFHHFSSKEEIGEAAIDAWCKGRAELYMKDLGDPADDPLERIKRLLDGLEESVLIPGEPSVCVLGMMSQELAVTHPRIRETCDARLKGWTGLVTSLLAAAKAKHPPVIDFDPEELAWMLNSLWQGSLLIAKTRQDPQIVVRNLQQARRFLTSHFKPE